MHRTQSRSITIKKEATLSPPPLQNVKWTYVMMKATVVPFGERTTAWVLMSANINWLLMRLMYSTMLAFTSCRQVIQGHFWNCSIEGFSDVQKHTGTSVLIVGTAELLLTFAKKQEFWRVCIDDRRNRSFCVVTKSFFPMISSFAWMALANRHNCSIWRDRKKPTKTLQRSQLQKSMSSQGIHGPFFFDDKVL